MDATTVDLLAGILLDHSARIDERDDAAAYLGDSDNAQSISALLYVARDPQDVEIISGTAGESLARIVIRTGNLDGAWITGMTATAKDEFVGHILGEHSDLLNGVDGTRQ